MEFSLKNLAPSLKAIIIGKNQVRFEHLSLDSRAVFSPEKTLFVALVTKRNDGHKYISQLYERGVRAFMISDNSQIDFESFKEAGFLLVPDTLIALQELASIKRALFKIPVIGITGSNGKTIVKEWLAQLLFSDENICRSPKSYNSQIGAPLSVWNLKRGNTLAIFEAGISHPGEMINLQKIIQPTHGIFTNLGSAHDENFSSRLQKANEKIKLFLKAKKIFFCSDHSVVVQSIRENKIPLEKLVSWGSIKNQKKNLNTVLLIKKIGTSSSGSVISLKYKRKHFQLSTTFNDQASIENLLHCCLYMFENKFSFTEIQNKIQQLNPLQMRMELKKGINECTVLNDSYSSDVESLSIALDFLNRQAHHQKKTAIISDIVESGQQQKVLYTTIAKLLFEKKIDRVIGIGENIFEYKNLFKGKKTFYKSIEDFLRKYNSSMFMDEAVLIKGARKFQFEKIGLLLQEKSHDTILEINLNALVHNLNYYRTLIKKEVKVMAMVKAFSYGIGSHEVAGLLQHHGVNYLAVAYSDEGVELRKAGIKLPIMVMNPEEQSFHDLIEFDLEPELFSIGITGKFLSFIKDHKIKKIPGVHLKLDTGMHRLGFESGQIGELILKLQASTGIKILSIFSHLAGSDNPALDDFTKAQIRSFKVLSKKIISELKCNPLLHICNSSAISRFKEAHFDMVRLGIGLYGVGVTQEERNNLMLAGSWRTKISQLKNIGPGDTVGYNRAAKVNKKTLIATVPVGYADGFSRRLSQGVGEMYIKNQSAPVIGNVCMDMCMLDVTEIATSNNLNEGDEVVIFDSAESLFKLSQKLQTIPYEVLTSVSPRVKRVYTAE